MILKSQIKKLLTGENPPIDVWHYLVGNYRYKLYYSKRFKFLIRKHIFDQIKYRIEWMDRECYWNGSCKLCGCETTHLQMASKPCNKPCYPTLMNKKAWEFYLEGGIIWDDNGAWTPFLMDNNKPTFITNDTRLRTEN